MGDSKIKLRKSGTFAGTFGVDAARQVGRPTRREKTSAAWRRASPFIGIIRPGLPRSPF